MAILNSSKHIAFCKVSAPKDAHNAGNAKAFFIFEDGGDSLIHITQKGGMDPAKFKSVQKIQAFLEKKKFLPKPGYKVPKKAKLVVGKTFKHEGKYHIEITAKVNGGGKTLLKTINWPKFGMPKYSNLVYGSAPDTAEEAGLKDSLKAAENISTNKLTQKVVNLHIKLRSEMHWLTDDSAPLQKLEDLFRHMVKYREKKCVDYLYERKDKQKFKDLNLELFTRSGFKQAYKECEAKIEALRGAEDEAADTAVGNEAADEDTGGEFSYDEQAQLITAAWLGGSTRKFNRLNSKYSGVLQQLWNEFKNDPDTVIELSRAIAGNSIERLLEIEWKLR